MTHSNFESDPPLGESDLEQLSQLARQTGLALSAKGQMICTAESCTGGMVAQFLTETSGSSAWFERSFVTYTNEAKVEMLEVDSTLIQVHGAVSEPVVYQMAEGALRRSRAHWSVAISGVAGPSGGSALKPVGTVWFAWAYRKSLKSGAEEIVCERLLFSGDRFSVRVSASRHALATVLHRLKA